jgi:hypothetical protein
MLHSAHAVQLLEEQHVVGPRKVPAGHVFTVAAAEDFTHAPEAAAVETTAIVVVATTTDVWSRRGANRRRPELSKSTGCPNADS